jgi:hypothetical protein
MNENKIGADSIGNFTLVDVGLDWAVHCRV